jgi:hypothetical protein
MDISFLAVALGGRWVDAPAVFVHEWCLFVEAKHASFETARWCEKMGR